MDVVTLNAAKKYAEQLGLGGAGLQEKVNEQVNVYLAKDEEELNTKMDELIEGRS